MFQFAQFLPMIAQMAGSMQSQQYGGSGGGGGGGGPMGGLGMAQGGQQPPALMTNPFGRSILGGLNAGMKTAPPPMPTDGSGAGGGGGSYQPPPDAAAGLSNAGGYGQQPQRYGQQQQQPLGYQGYRPAGNGGLSGPIEGISGAGPAPTEASNFARVFGGAGLNIAPMQQQQGGGLLPMLLGMLQGGLRSGMR